MDEGTWEIDDPDGPITFESRAEAERWATTISQVVGHTVTARRAVV